MTNTKSSPFSVDQARELMAAIRRQVFVPEVTTMGACATGCGNPARGGGTCADCLGTDLGELIDSSAGVAYVYACEALREAERSVMSQVEMMGGGRK